MGTKKSDCVAMFPESIEKVQKSMPKDCEIDKVVSFFKVLADDTRIRILYALKEQEMCAGDIAVFLDMTKSAVSHQLAVMRKMHQVRARREGKNVFYSLDDQHIVDIMEEVWQMLQQPQRTGSGLLLSKLAYDPVFYPMREADKDSKASRELYSRVWRQRK